MEKQICQPIIKTALFIYFIALIHMQCILVNESGPVIESNVVQNTEDSVTNQGYSYTFHPPGYKMVLSDNGRLLVSDLGRGEYAIDLFHDPTSKIDIVAYCLKAKTLVILCQFKTFKTSETKPQCTFFIIDLSDRKLVWKQVFGKYNLSPAVLQDKYLYVATLGYIGKFDIITKKLIWEQNDLWEKFQLNNITQIMVQDKQVIFMGKVFASMPDGKMSSKTTAITVHKFNGKTIAVK